MKTLTWTVAALLAVGLGGCLAPPDEPAHAGIDLFEPTGDAAAALHGGHRPPRAEPTVFATGLTNPRHMRVGPDGLLYVAEAGVGGEQLATCEPADNMFTAAGPYRGGLTGRVSRIHADGTVETVAEGFASVVDGTSEVLGPTDIAWIGRTLYVLTEGGGCTHGHADHPTGVVRVGRDGSQTYVADVSAFIRANPPEVEPMCGPTGDCEPDGVPTSMIAAGGMLYVVETNHNSILRVDPRSGHIERLHDLSAMDPAPIRIRRLGRRALISTFDGDLLAMDLSRPRRPIEVVQTGFNPIVDLVDFRGRLHLLETFTEPWTGDSGRLLRRRRDGSTEVVVDRLNFPIGLAEWRGDLYVSVNSYFQGPVAGTGQVVKVRCGRD